MAQILSEIFSYSTQQFINNPIIVREIILKSQQTRDQIINSLHISEGSLKTFINNQMVKNTFKLTEKAYIELKLQFLEKQSPCLQKKILSAQLSELQYKGFSYPPSFVNILVQSFNSNDKLYDIIVGKSSKENSDSKNGDFTEQSNYQILVLSEID
uniref:Uncharacterized protein n=1 Tax=Spironucleus salmonicida TaxID=348837 RepID=V6LDW1_9EUKA|eukprot:EST42680.1 Hypothetical protein SS50377_17698 [Spironucleus salmonicida]